MSKSKRSNKQKLDVVIDGLNAFQQFQRVTKKYSTRKGFFFKKNPKLTPITEKQGALPTQEVFRSPTPLSRQTFTILNNKGFFLKHFLHCTLFKA